MGLQFGRTMAAADQAPRDRCPPDKSKDDADVVNLVHPGFILGTIMRRRQFITLLSGMTIAWPFASRGQILVQTPRGFPEQVNGLVSHVGRMRSDRAKRAAMHAATSQIQTKHVGLIDEGTWMKPGALPLNEIDAWQTQRAAVLKRLRPKLLVPCTTRM